MTELSRVEKVLERDLAVRRYLGPKASRVRKRSGEPVYFAAEAVAVARALMAANLNPERAAVVTVLAVAAEVLGIGDAPKSAAAPPGD